MRTAGRNACAKFAWSILGALLLPGPATLAQGNSPTILVATSCEALPPGNCQGKFGFLITVRDGSWRAGPDPATGRTYTGKLTGDESAQLREALKPVLDAQAHSRLQCAARPVIPGVSETVEVKAPGKSDITLRGAGGQLDAICAAAGSAYAALFKTSDTVMQAHYPKKF
jgi:hypothetical protein